MSDTARTNELLINLCDEATDGKWKYCFTEMAALARTLERENNALIKQVHELETRLAHLKD